MSVTKTASISFWKAWILAFRLKTLPIGIIPILAGTFITPLPLKDLNFKLLLLALLCSLCIQIATNLINDALDTKRGADTKQRIGPLRVTQSGLLSPVQVLAGGFSFLFLAFCFGIPLIEVGGGTLFFILALSILCSYLYTGGPLPLAYAGLGELFVILFYGFVAVCTSFFLQMKTLYSEAFLLGLQMGLLASVPLAINNLRDLKEDMKTGKKTLAVRFGRNFVLFEITLGILLPFLLNSYWYFINKPLAFFLPMSALLIGVQLLLKIYKTPPGAVYNRFLAQSSFLLFLFGSLMILGHRWG